jgi:hypothetical protein
MNTFLLEVYLPVEILVTVNLFSRLLETEK